MQLTNMRLTVTAPKNERGYAILGWGLDVNGKSLYEAWFSDYGEKLEQTIEPTVNFVNPVRFNVDYYPNYIGENIEIELEP